MAVTEKLVYNIENKTKEIINEVIGEKNTLADYGIANAYTKEEANNAILLGVQQSNHLNRQTVASLPSVSDANENTIYMVSIEDGEAGNYYDEYILTNGNFEKIGNSKVDLTDYATKQYVTDNTVKASEIVSGSANGTISVDGTDVAVKGLGSAAYTASTAYATKAQGAKIDNLKWTNLTGKPTNILGSISSDSSSFLSSTVYNSANSINAIGVQTDLSNVTNNVPTYVVSDWMNPYTYNEANTITVFGHTLTDLTTAISKAQEGLSHTINTTSGYVMYDASGGATSARADQLNFNCSIMSSNIGFSVGNVIVRPLSIYTEKNRDQCIAIITVMDTTVTVENGSFHPSAIYWNDGYVYTSPINGIKYVRGVLGETAEGEITVTYKTALLSTNNIGRGSASIAGQVFDNADKKLVVDVMSVNDVNSFFSDVEAN